VEKKAVLLLQRWHAELKTGTGHGLAGWRDSGECRGLRSQDHGYSANGHPGFCQPILVYLVHQRKRAGSSLLAKEKKAHTLRILLEATSSWRAKSDCDLYLQRRSSFSVQQLPFRPTSARAVIASRSGQQTKPGEISFFQRACEGAAAPGKPTSPPHTRASPDFSSHII